MKISKISISGLRGFSSKQTLELAIPNDEKLPGCGLTIIVGPNNSGKSTVIEAFNSFTQSQPPSFPDKKRNIKVGKRIEISLQGVNNHSITIKTVEIGGSETQYITEEIEPNSVKPFIVPSRRMFSPYFGKIVHNRDAHILNYQLPAQRGLGYNQFGYRLFQIQSDKKLLNEFNNLLEKVLDAPVKWYIEQEESGNYFLKFIFEESEHTSDGAGEGLLSIFTIVDALYDSNKDDLVVIDEPELSVHPSLQKRLLELFIEYSADRQIVISTHSPYFIQWEAILNGAKIARVVKEENSSKIYQLMQPSVDLIRNLVFAIDNPHVLGLTANEVFFLHENVVLVEGQEDVVIYKKIAKDLGIPLKGEFFGWGVGGAHNMEIICSILRDLGFKKVVGILDNDKKHLIPNLEQQFDYLFLNITADDVRDKSEVKAKAAKQGIASSKGVIKIDHQEELKSIFETINKNFS